MPIKHERDKGKGREPHRGRGGSSQLNPCRKRHLDVLEQGRPLTPCENTSLPRAGRAQILQEVCHIQLLDIPPPTSRRMGPSLDEWCKFHYTSEHKMENCKTLQSQIEKLIRSGHLGRFI
ncbi:hypothetical protein CR513_32166, partial [Mucuna pruriens]